MFRNISRILKFLFRKFCLGNIIQKSWKYYSKNSKNLIMIKMVIF